MAIYTGVKIFSTTLARDRESHGREHHPLAPRERQLEIVDKVVTQSSDKEFHCLTITLFYREREAAK